MALENIAARLTGYFTKMPKSEAYNIVNDAWKDIRNNRVWSFQLVEDSIATPNVINTGTFATVQGTNTVTADAVASAAITGVINPFLTLRQFRITSGGVYNIIAADFTIPNAVVLTLDRTYTDPTGTGQSYQIYQCYFAAPVADFKRWIDWRDLTNGDWLSVYQTRREINYGDPQRLYFTFPHWVLPFGIDNRGAGTPTPSATLGFPMYELYPNPLSYVSYMRWWMRTGPDLINPGDTVPYPMDEDLLFARSRMKACEIAEGNRDPTVPRGQAADYKFIYGAAKTEYDSKLKEIGFKDRDIVDTYINRLRRNDNTYGLNRLAYYSTISGRAYYGG